MDGGAAHGAARSWSGQQIRFMTAGSVDDGKSTLIGRLLLDSHALMRDQAAGLEGDDIDLAALTDGLEAERAQGITIDVGLSLFRHAAHQLHHCGRPRARAIHAQHGHRRERL